MVSWRRLLRAARARGPSSLAVLVAGVTACLAAALAPLLAQAVGAATLSEALAAQSPADLSVTVDVDTYAAVAGDPRATQGLDATLGSARLDDFYRPPRSARLSRDYLHATRLAPGPATSGAPRFETRLAFQADGCEQYGVRAGRCPERDREVAVSARDARALGLRLGERLSLMAYPDVALQVRVVGVFGTPPSLSLLSYGQNGGPSAADVAPPRTALDPFLVTQPVMDDRLADVSQTLAGRRDLVPGSLDTDTGPRLRTALRGFEDDLAEQPVSWARTTPILATLDRVDAQRRVVALTLPVIGLQVVLVVWVGLALLVRALSRARSDEWALARLRGLGTRQVLRVALGGPALLLVLAGPVGLALATVLAGPLLRLVDVHTALQPFRARVLLAVLVAVAGSLVALVLASVQALRMPMADLLHRSAPVGGRSGRLMLVVETLVVVLAAGGVYQLTAGSSLRSPRQDGLDLLTPALVAVAAGLIAARVSSLVLTRVSRRRGARPATLLATRRLAHSPGVLRTAVVVVAGVAVAVSAVSVEAVADRNRHLRAGQEIGADRVLRVTVPPGASLLHLVRRADPSGRSAMAVVEETGDGILTSTSRIVALDVSRYAAVARTEPSWSGMSDRTLAHRLRPPTPPAVRLRGRTVRIVVSGVGILQLLRSPVPNPVRLGLTVDTGTTWQSVDLGRLRQSDAPYRLKGALPCPDGCRVVSLAAYGVGRPFQISLRLDALSTDTQGPTVLRPVLTRSGRWRSTPELADPGQPTAIAGPSPDGLGLLLRNPSGAGDDTPSIYPTDVPFPLPALVAKSVSLVPEKGLVGASTGSGLDGADQPLRLIGRADVLPRAGPDGALVDLQNADLSADRTPARRKGLVDEVWLTSSAPPSVTRYLQAHGVQVVGSQTAAQREHRLSRAGPARASAVATGAAAAALLLALMVGFASLLLGTRRRLYELAALRVTGLGQRALRWAVLLEVGGLLGPAAAVGTVAGVLATRLELPGLPFYGDGAGPPLDLGQDGLLLLGLLSGVLLVIAAASAVTAAILVRSAVPERLREGLR